MEEKERKSRVMKWNLLAWPAGKKRRTGTVVLNLILTLAAAA